MRETTLSRFTPSLLSSDSLEALLVQRHHLADSIVAGIRESALTGNKHYYLLIGPRGIGKTHLVSLIFHRVEKDAEIKERLRIAWLREEEWGVASYFHLLRVILRSLAERYGEEITAEYEQMLKMEDVAEAERVAEELLRKFVGKKTLLLLAENFDEIFSGLGEEGQEKLRAYIQNHPFFTIVAAAQSLFGGVTLREEPFYGFFETHHLDELTYQEAVELVANIAKHEDKPSLAEALRSPKGRARMRAVHHLAGGNPRVYVIFSQFVTEDSIQNLVRPLLQTLDGLTPYYQSRMSLLPAQQRQIVEHLCEVRGAKSVKDITQACFISSQQTTSGQLKKLHDWGYVRSTSHGRESLYELREPLLRLTLDVKKCRGEPVGFIIDFLRIWYSADELARRIADVSDSSAPDQHHLAAVLQAAIHEGAFDLAALSEAEYEYCTESEKFPQALAASEELVAIRGTMEDVVRHALSSLKCEKWDDAIRDLTMVIIRSDIPVELLVAAHGLRGQAMGRLGDKRGEIEDYTAIIDMPNVAGMPRAMAILNRGVAKANMNDTNGAIADYTAVIEMSDAPVEQRSLALFNRGFRKRLLGDAGGEVEDYTAVIEMPQAPAEQRAKALINRGVCKSERGDFTGAVADVMTVIDMSEVPAIWQSVALQSRGAFRGQMDDTDGAMADANVIINLHDAPTWLRGPALLNRGRCKHLMGDATGAVADYTAVVDMPSASPVLISTAQNFIGAIFHEAGNFVESLSSFDRALSANPQDREAMISRGEVLACMGRTEDALRAFARAREVGPDESAFKRDSNAAATQLACGRIDEGRVALGAAVADLARIKGEDGDSKVSIVRNLLLRSQAPIEWRRMIPEFVKPFAEQGMMLSFGQGVVASIRTLRNADVTPEIARQWLEVWRELTGSFKEMALPLRLLEAAVRYLPEKDDRPLLGLAIEERKIVEPLLGIVRE